LNFEQQFSMHYEQRMTPCTVASFTTRKTKPQNKKNKKKKQTTTQNYQKGRLVVSGS